MQRLTRRAWIKMLVVLGVVVVRPPALMAAVPASVYPLELVSPRASGTAPSADSGVPNMPSGHRIFKAYPGIEYNIRAAVLGGAYPYTFTLSNQPSGMTVNASTGEISWPNPTGTTETPTLTVTDSENTQVSSSWEITITTSGFLFYDITSGNDANAGTLASPRQTLSHCRDNSTGSIVYFRAGTYGVAGLPVVSYGTGHERTSWGPGRGSSVQLLAYPGETVVWDHGYQVGVEPGLMFDLEPESHSSSSQPLYFDGIEFTKVSNCLLRLQIEGHYHTFRRCTFSFIYEPTSGDNPGGIMHATTGSPRWHCTYQDNVGHDLDLGQTAGMYKFYAVRKALIEDDEAYDCGAPFDLKFSTPRFEVRGGWYHDNVYDELGVVGNQNGQTGHECFGEIRYNRITARGYSGGTTNGVVIGLNNFARTEQVDCYRNTLVGKIRIEPAALDTGGPFKFYNNVIINDNSGTDRITLDNLSNTGLLDIGSGSASNVTGAIGSAIVDEAGDLALIGASRTAYLGTHGHEIQGGGGGSSSGPVRLRIRG